jgi:thiol-disulfide isomerase/thioredoxin
MKKILNLLPLLLLLVFFQSCEKPLEDKIVVNVDNLQADVNTEATEGYVSISFIDSTGRRMQIDTLKQVEGKYVYNGDIPTKDGYSKAKLEFTNPSLKREYAEGRFFPSKAASIDVYLLEGSKVEFDVKINDDKSFITYTVLRELGPTINTDIAKLTTITYPLEDASADTYTSRLESYYAAENKDEYFASEEYKANEELFKKQTEELNQAKQKFIGDNPASFASVLMLDGLVSYDSDVYMLESTFNLLSDENKSTELGKKLSDYINNKLSIQVGQNAPEIKGTAFGGNDFDLANILGEKFVIVDFWGTWCGPCVNGMPHMAEYYRKYADKLEIVGVASDRLDPWTKFLNEKTEYNWIHLLDEERSIIDRYAIEAFPTKFILNPKGEIVYSEIGESQKFYDKLDELMAE